MSFLKKDLFKFLEAVVSLIVIVLAFSVFQGSFSWLVGDISISEKFAIFVAVSAYIRTYL